MPKPVAQVGEGHEDASGNGVYSFIRDLIVEGRDARFVDKKGRYVINWSRALKCYHYYKSKRNPQYKSKNISRRKASNGLRAALLNFYKKEGAKEYKECKKVNEKDEVVERQFQMPPRVFESLFGSDVQLSDDSSEHETSNIISEADEKPLATPNSSDTGFDEVMDISDDLFNANEDPSSHCALGGLPAGDPLCSNVKTEEDQGDPSDITTPCQMFGISGEDLDLVIGEICSSSDTNDIDLLGVVHDICPSSGSVKGGIRFFISLTEELSEDDKSGIAHFDGIGDVSLERLNCYTLAGTIPASQRPGTVPVTVNTQDGRLLGMTCFMYVDEIQEVLKQVVKDPALQSLYLTMWSQEHGFFGSDGNLDPFTLEDQGSSIQGTHAQALKGLQLLVYTAAQTNAQQFIQMIFSTSAGRLVFNAYKDRPQLPEDVARANGHDDLAQYLQDVNTGLSKENNNDAQPSSIDWLELIEAVNKVQKQSSVIEDETDLEIGRSKDDDNQSDYFADAETSSCGSFEIEFEWSDSEDGEGRCSKGGGSDKEPDVKSAPSMNVMPWEAYAEVETQSDNDLDLEDDKNYEEPATVNSKVTSSLPCPFSEDEQSKKQPDERLTQKNSMEGTSSEAPTVLETNLDNELDQKDDGKNDIKLSTTEVGKSSLTSQLSKKVAASGKEEASTVASQEKTTKQKRTRKWLKGDHVITSSQRGPCVNETQEVPSFRERFFQRVTGGGTQNRENINERKDHSTTGPSQAKRHKQRTQWRPFRRTLLKSFLLLTIAVITVLCLAAGIKLRERQLLHWAVRNGHIRISQALLKFVSDVDAPNVRGETLLHVAAKNGYEDLAGLLMKLGSNVNSKDYQQQTPLHLAAWSGCQGIVNALIRHGSDVNARDDFQQTALHLAVLNGHRNTLQVLLQSGSDANAKQRLGRTPLHLAAMAGHKEAGEVLVQHGSVSNILDDREYILLCFRLVQLKVQHGIDVEARFEMFQRSALHGAAIHEHKPIVELLIHHGSDVNARDVFGATPLHAAVYNSRRNIAEVLIQNGSDVNARDIIGKTPLHLAVRSGDQEMTEFLIQQGSELEAQDNSQQTALHLAAQNGHRNIAEVVIQNGSDVNARDIFGQTPLHLAVRSGDQEITELFIQQGSELEAQDNSQQTALHLAAQNRHRNVAEVLIRHGSDVNARDIFGQTPLHLAVGSGDQEITELLIQQGSKLEAQDNSQQTVLHLAAQNRHRNVAEVIIRYGSDVNARDIFGQTPLHLTVKSGDQEITELLIQRGSELEAQDNSQQTPLHLAAWNGQKNIAEVLLRFGSDVNVRNKFGETPLHLAARSGDQQITEFLLPHGSEPKTQDDLQLILFHLAAQNRHRNVAEVLILYGSDVNVRNMFGETPLHLAVRGGHKQIVEVFLHYGSDVNARDGFHQAPIHSAARNGHKNIVEAQIRYRCDVNTRDTFLQVDLHLATRSGHREITGSFRRLGSGLMAQDDFKHTALNTSAQNRHRNVSEVLIRCGRDNGANKFGLTPLQLTVRGGHKVFLHHISDENARDGLQQIPVLLAAKKGYKNTTDALIRYRSNGNARDIFGQTSLHLAVRNGHKNVTEVLTRDIDECVHAKLGDSPLHLAAWSGHQERTEYLISHGSERKARDDFQPNADVNNGQSPHHMTAENGYKLIISRHETCHPFNNNFRQTSCELLRIHWRTRSCLASVNMYFALESRDHKLKLERPSVTQFLLSISPGGGEIINRDINLIKYVIYSMTNSAYQGLHSRYTCTHVCCSLCTYYATTNGRPKDRDGNEAKVSHSFGYMHHSFGYMHLCIKNGTNKVLIRSAELPLKEIAYEGNHLVNATVLLLLITLVTLCTVLRIRLYYLVEIIRMKGAYNGCRAPSNSSTGATASKTNGSQNGQSSPPVQEGCEDSKMENGFIFSTPM